MQVHRLLATSANDRSYAELIREACEAAQPTEVRAAVAYVTHSGVGELCGVLDTIPTWQNARKQWLVGIDYCRSDPNALAHLASIRRSNVRIHDGLFVSGRSGCVPRTSFHPKLYVFKCDGGAAVVVGSGNLSQTGLRVGVEAAASLRSSAGAPLQPIIQWFGQMWQAATPLNRVAAAYGARYATHDNRLHPTPVEDDAAPPSAGTRGQLTPLQLRQLRVCEHLWIQAGNLHENRGAGQPGNQLMLKRNSRVFFGFQGRDLPTDSAIGHVTIQFGNTERDDCSLRFSNNSMDVLTLPIPVQGGPPAYDQETLLFTRIGVRRFRLELAQNGDVGQWRRRSRTIDAAFSMKGGREWGVY